MGKGDKRTRRGKLFKGTYGKSRPRKRPAKTTAGQSKGPAAPAT